MPTLTPSRVMGVPLPQLLAEANARLVEVDLDDRRFFGSLVDRRDGGLLLAMPTGQDPEVQDTIARALLARKLGVPLAPLPSRFEMSELAAV